MARKRKAPELTFQQHVADYLVREHGYGVLEQSDITDTVNYIAEDHLWAFLKATQAETLKQLSRLNRCHEGKQDVVVVDFTNNAAAILKARRRRPPTRPFAARLIDEKGLEVKAEDLTQLEGVGDAKATLILAAIEFARRRIKPAGAKIATPADLLPHVRHYADRKQEHFLCASINGANEVLNIRVVSIGCWTISSSTGMNTSVFWKPDGFRNLTSCPRTGRRRTCRARRGPDPRPFRRRRCT